MKILSLFSGAGGLDYGFSKAPFNITHAIENDKTIWATYEKNYPKTLLLKQDISKIESSYLNDFKFQGLIGGPPCQSWSCAGKQEGLKSSKGQLFLEYLRILKITNPLFFVAENVKGILSKKHSESLNFILNSFKELKYKIFIMLLNANDFGVAQERERVFFIGFQEKLNIDDFSIKKEKDRKNLEIIRDLSNSAKGTTFQSLKSICSFPNHEYLTSGFSPQFMSRNRVKAYNECSYTILASARHIVLHPQAPKMIKISKDLFEFDNANLPLYRRLSVRECARIQSFPDDFIFEYNSIYDGYKMVGNAVPPKLSIKIAEEIKNKLKL
nr:DNA cytosine methyltransferase [Campylobacter sp. RM12651]